MPLLAVEICWSDTHNDGSGGWDGLRSV